MIDSQINKVANSTMKQRSFTKETSRPKAVAASNWVFYSTDSISLVVRRRNSWENPWKAVSRVLAVGIDYFKAERKYPEVKSGELWR